MTALIALRHDQGVEIYSDAVGYDDKGVARHFQQKADIVLHLPAIIASRGSGFAGLFFKMYATLENSFDELIDRLEDILRAACHDAARLGDPINLVVYIGGYSQRRNEWLIHYMHWSQIDDEDTPKSFELKTVNQAIFDPYPAPEALQTMLTDEGYININGDDGIIKMMQLNRETKHGFGPRSGDEKGCIVGGFVQKTCLGADGAYTVIIHRWNDKLGKPLDPSNDQLIEQPESALAQR